MISRPMGVCLLLLGLSLAANLGQWEKERRQRGPTVHRVGHRYELHGTTVFDAETGDLYTLAGIRFNPVTGERQKIPVTDIDEACSAVEALISKTEESNAQQDVFDDLVPTNREPTFVPDQPATPP